MSTNDNHIIKMPHMFQKNNVETKAVSHDIDSYPELEKNLSRIMKRYRSNQDNHLEVKTNSLVSNVKNLLESQTNDEIQILYDYLEEMKKKFVSINMPIVENKEQHEVIVPVEEEELLEHSNNENQEVNIDDILQKTEKDIVNTTDQKSLLKSLIDDINCNSSNKSYYDDSQFERNIAEIMNDSDDENDNEEVNNEEINDGTNFNTNTQVRKKNKLSYILFITILILFIIAGYLYKDILFEFIDKINI